MTLSQLRLDIYRGLGEPSFWNPATDISDGGNPRLTRVCNDAQRIVAMYKDGRGRHVRHRKLIDSMYYAPTNFTDTIAAVNNDTFPYYITVDGDNVGTGDDRYNGWIVEITSGDADGEMRLIYDYDSDTGTLYFPEAFNVEPSADDTIKMYKNFELLLPSTHDWASEHIILPSTTDNSRATGNLIEVLSLLDINEKRELTKAYKSEKFENNIESASDPTMWKMVGNKVFYNYAVDDDKVFQLYYYRTPTDMTEDTDEPELEEQFHYGIYLQGLIWGYGQTGEYKKKYSTEQDFTRFMATTINQYDVECELSDPRGVIRWEE